MEDVPNDVFDILNTVASTEEILKPTFSFHARNRRGVGYNGDVYFVTIQDQENMKKLQVVVKKASEIEKVRSSMPVTDMYVNECEFYESIWPLLLKFQESVNNAPVVIGMPKCYATQLLKSREKLVLENLKFSNFETINTRVFLDEPHFELIFNRYGRFHGLSLAFKDKFPKTFKLLQNKLFDFWGCLPKMTMIAHSVSHTLHEAANYLDQDSKHNILKSFEKYVDEGYEGLMKASKYNGRNSVILHGDSFSNNLMFKYDESRSPIDLRFIDFQALKTGSPVFDLAYCFYSGATADILKDLDYFLTIYHDSLSETLIKFECDPTKIFTRKSLYDEWKTYCKFGFIMGLVLLKTKCTFQNKHMDMVELLANPDPSGQQSGRLNVQEYKQRVLDLIHHMHVKEFL